MSKKSTTMATETTPQTALSPSTNGPTLHHLNHSQSQRILWLLEELNTPYTVTLHERQTTPSQKHRSPPSLQSIHPTGKSPILITADGKTTISESTTIARYLIETYDKTGAFTAEDWIRDDSLCSFAGASMGTVVFFKLFMEMIGGQSPWFVRPLVKGFAGGVDKVFSVPEIKKALGYLQDCLGEGEFFGGGKLVRCDFILSYPLDMVADRGWVDFEAEFPKLAAWRKRCQGREGWKRALEKGNGYDNSVF